MDTKKILLEFKAYLKVKDYSNLYLNLVTVYLSFCSKSNLDFKVITYQNLNSFILYLKDKKLSNGYINNFIKSIRFFYKFLVDIDMLKPNILNIINKVKLFKVEVKVKDFITLKELDKLVLDCINYHESMDYRKIKTLLNFMFYTGLRRNELLNLKRQDINLIERTALIRVPTKNKNERIVLFPKKVAVMLEEYFQSEDETINAFNMTIATMMHFFNFLKQFVPEGKRISAHTLRHSFANMLASEGVDISIAQKLLGHKDINSTLIYYNPNLDIIKKIYRQKIR